MLLDAIKQAQDKLKKNLEDTYDGKCTVYEKRAKKDPGTKITYDTEKMVLLEEPCHVSYGGSPAAAGSNTITTKSQSIKLFIAPEIEIKPGSKIVILQQGRMETYGRSGQPAIYSSHQEIELELWKGYT